MAATILGHQSSSGFYKAPVCKGLLSSIFITFTVAHVPVLSPYLRTYVSCEIPAILASPQIWRLILNRFTFMYSKDFLCAALLLYYFRILERRMGSRKFASHIVGTSIMSTMLEISAILYLSSDIKSGLLDDGKIFLPPGLYSLVFPSFVNYFWEIPTVTVTKFLGVPITVKTLTYLLGLQMACNNPVAAAAGLLAGVLHHYNVLYVKKWLVVPEVVSNVCSRLLGWIFDTRKPVLGQMGATLELQRQEEMERYEQQYMYRRAHDFHSTRAVQRGQGYADRINGENSPDVPQVENRSFLRQLLFPGADEAYPRLDQEVEPSEEHLAVLLQMGFDRARSIEALRASRNNLTTATSILLRQ